jgi:hypothetical protein
MYKNYEEYWINLNWNQLDPEGLYTTYFAKKIKPCRNAFLTYYYSADFCKILFIKDIIVWLKYDHFMTIGLKHGVFSIW